MTSFMKNILSILREKICDTAESYKKMVASAGQTPSIFHPNNRGSGVAEAKEMKSKHTRKQEYYPGKITLHFYYQFYWFSILYILPFSEKIS